MTSNNKTNPTNLAPAQDVDFICSIVEDIGEVCDGAIRPDGVGFNKPDQIFVDLVRRYPRERWTAADVASAAANLLKYHGQMPAASHKRLKALAAEDADPRAVRVIAARCRAAERLKVAARGDAFLVSFPYRCEGFETFKSTIKSAGGRWQPYDKVWQLPHAAASIAAVRTLTTQHLFGLTGEARELFETEPLPAYRIEARGDSLAVISPFDRAVVDTMRLIKGRRWDGAAKLNIIPTTADLGLLAPFNFEVMPCARKLIEENQAAMVEADSVTWHAFDASKLYPHQAAGIEYLRGRKCALLRDEMGLGKTIQALLALPDNARALVVVPASLKYNWAAECNRWRPDLSPVILSGGGSFRWPEPGELVILNYDILTDKPGRAPGGVVLVADEVQLVKNNKAQRTKRFRILANAVSRTGGRRWLMTGTPLLRNPADLWAVMLAAGIHREAYPSGFETFAYQWGGRHTGYRGALEWDHEKIDPIAGLTLQSVSLGRLRANVIDLPAKRHAVHTVEVPDNVAPLTDEELKTLESCEDIEELRGKPIFERIAAARAKLAQFKAPLALDLARETVEGGGGPIIVFSAHATALDSFKAMETAYFVAFNIRIETLQGSDSAERRAEVVEAFQAGKIDILALTIGVGQVGLTLTKSCRMLFIDRDWSPAVNRQAEDRINRIGQDRTCDYTTIVAARGVDRLIAASIARKAEMMKHAEGVA